MRCSDCQSYQFREVHGDITCIGCGLVKEAHVLVDQPPSYGYFEDSDSKTQQKQQKQQQQSQQQSQKQWQKQWQQKDQHESISSDDFIHVQNILHVSHDTINLARDILVKACKEQGIKIRGQERRLMFAAVAVYYACKHLPGGGKTKEEICCCLGLSSKGFGRVCTEIRTSLCEVGPVDDAMLKDLGIDDLVNRHILLLSSQLNEYKCSNEHKCLDKTKLRSTIYKLYYKVKPFETTLACAPHILVTTLLFMALKFLKVRITMKKVANACGTCVATIIQYESMIRDLLST